MKKLLISTILSLGFAAAGQAATLDFTSATFVPTFDAMDAVETVDGVTFTITPVARGADGFRQNANGLSFGVPGNGMASISIVASADVVFESLTGIGHTLTAFADQLSFDISAGGVETFSDFSFPSAVADTFSLGANGLTVAAGQALFLEVDFDVLTGASPIPSVFASATIGNFEFSVPTTTPVPLPAGLPLMLGGLAAFGLMRRKA